MADVGLKEEKERKPRCWKSV